MKLLTLYIFFAVIATLMNILGQEISLYLWDGYFSISLSIFMGTAVGLVAKYILDKKYIFEYQPSSAREDGKIFFIYSLMGLITTLIFWIFELGFEYIFHDKYWRYLGAILGLSIGYYIKFHLDKRYVFNMSTI